MRQTNSIFIINIISIFFLSSLCFAEEDVNDLVSKGIESYKLENYKTSYDYFRKAMKINPLHPEASQWYWRIKSERDVKNLTDKGPAADDKRDKTRQEKMETPKKEPGKPLPKAARPENAIDKEMKNKIINIDGRITTLLKRINEQNREMEARKAKDKKILDLKTDEASIRTTILVAVFGSVSLLMIVFTFVGISWSRKRFKKLSALSGTADERMVHFPAVLRSSSPERPALSDNRIISIQQARKLLTNEGDLSDRFLAAPPSRPMDPLSSIAREYFENTADLPLIQRDREHSGLMTDAGQYYRRLEATVAGFVYLIEKKLNRINNDTKVRTLCNEIGMRIGLTSNEIIDLRLGSLLKDIGFLLVPEDIFFKAGKLTEGEKTEVRKHVSYSLKIAQFINMPGEVLEALVNHHELYNSSGYPSGIGGDEIPLHSRIISICDGYVSLTSDRPHRKSIETGKALKIIEKESDRYDPDLLRIFFEILRNKKT